MRKMLVAVIATAVCAFLAAGCNTGLTASTSAAPSRTAVSSAAASPSPSATETASPSPSASVQAGGTEPEQPYKVAVEYDLATEENSQKSVDEGHSPWRLDPAFVAQVFVSLQLEPGGIQGDYPIPYEDFEVTRSSQAEVVVTVNNEKSPTAKVYLKQLVRQGSGGIWTVVGYDPK